MFAWFAGVVMPDRPALRIPENSLKFLRAFFLVVTTYFDDQFVANYLHLKIIRAKLLFTKFSHLKENNTDS